MKTHYAILESAANESDNNDYWSDPICGQELAVNDLSVDNDWKYVDCKKCIARKELHEHSMKEAMEHSCNDMDGFVKFMESQK